mmetsp:Transcript_1908/g.6651  ORF Transcript_1908/g.6651 Transcript_1908/m.6651 type:complete len:201 (-) Transcript_1908:748-1350(-)
MLGAAATSWLAAANSRLTLDISPSRNVFLNVATAPAILVLSHGSASPAPSLSSSLSSCATVGTAIGSKVPADFGSMGTQTRPVLGCTQKGALSRWFMCLDTSTSSLGYVCAKTISCTARDSWPARRLFVLSTELRLRSTAATSWSHRATLSSCPPRACLRSHRAPRSSASPLSSGSMSSTPRISFSSVSTPCAASISSRQ